MGVTGSIRVAVIDSGVSPRHPHIRGLAGGIGLHLTGEDTNYLDVLGHGTAVTGAICEKASGAEIYAVKVFDRQLATSGNVLLRALDWCIDQGMNFVNLSLGTTNESYVSAFRERLVRAQNVGTTIVAAYSMGNRPAYPGCLSEVAGVVLDAGCPRDRYTRVQQDGKLLYGACGFPRDIPGVPPERNLHGISFAVANVTGFLAAEAAGCFHP